MRAVERVLSEEWRGYVTDTDHDPEDVAEAVAPFGPEWPGLAPVVPGPWADADALALKVLAEVVEWQRRQHAEYAGDEARGVFGGQEEFALGRPYRSAEIPALFEERGPGFGFPYDTSDLVAVLASWEERFGTRLVGLAPHRLIVSVAARVRTIAAAERIAVEHFAFSTDTVVQGDDEVLSAHAAHQVLGREVWSFWWD
ncbi:DUF4253 domain-containing protein [Streptomyces liangshanensis]|uniref:DUF4253 domain-containing protein n=1 Tax=Streptomyces liangshanensis TaxID=2717324 RepID=UPI0036DE6D6C